MPLPVLFIGIAAATGSVGIGTTVKAGFDTNKAMHINQSANELVEQATDRLSRQKTVCGKALEQLGEEKLYLINSSMASFLETFSKIKNVDFRDSEGLEELRKMHIDSADFEEMKSLVSFASSIAGGAVAGTAGGALIAFGTYSAAQALACASTGTAIASLSGAAASNATLAFFGGGSLATGGLGMAGGTVVLGSLVAGPALLVLGVVTGIAAKKNLDKAYTNKAEAIQIAEKLDTASQQCEAIRRRTYMFYTLLARLDAYFLPLIYRMEDIVKTEGDDYRQFQPESKKIIASCAAAAVSVKAVLDTPILNDDGLLTEESETTLISTQSVIDTYTNND